jgi:hypothetical protein
MRSPETCPICEESCPFVDCDSVDVGVGVIEGNFVYNCAKHGEWCAGSNGVVFREQESDGMWQEKRGHV